MSARSDLTAALTAALPDFDVIGYADQLDGVPGKTVMLWASGMQRQEKAGRQMVMVTLDLWVLTGHESTEFADDELDEALDEVLAALQPITWIGWTDAERLQMQQSFHGWKVTVQAVAVIEET